MSKIAANILKSFSFLTILIEPSKGQKMTGYEIMKRVSSLGFETSAGTIYPPARHAIRVRHH